jgi:hypothetical protein
MKLHRWILVLLFSAVGFPALAQQLAASGPEWQITKKSDPSSGTRNVVFTLAGKFLTPPKSGSSDHPTIVVTCNPDKHVRGLLGNLVSATLNVGAPLKINYIEPEQLTTGISYYPKVVVQYRVDERKPEDDQWNPNSEKTGANLDKDVIKKLIYDRKVPVRRVEIYANENEAGQIVMQFDMPDPTQMAKTCGIFEKK